MADVIGRSDVNKIVVVLDYCFFFGAGRMTALADDTSGLRGGVSILTACRDNPMSREARAGGQVRSLFANYLEGALEGGAADILGRIIVARLYAYLSESFSVWGKRPTFKTDVDRLNDLRQCTPSVLIGTLRELIIRWFPTLCHEFPLGPSYEPDKTAFGVVPHPEVEVIFGRLQLCRANKLVEPVDHQYLCYAAMESLRRQLTPLGRPYWELVNRGYL